MALKMRGEFRPRRFWVDLLRILSLDSAQIVLLELPFQLCDPTVIQQIAREALVAAQEGTGLTGDLQVIVESFIEQVVGTLGPACAHDLEALAEELAQPGVEEGLWFSLFNDPRTFNDAGAPEVIGAIQRSKAREILASYKDADNRLVEILERSESGPWSDWDSKILKESDWDLEVDPLGSLGWLLQLRLVRDLWARIHAELGMDGVEAVVRWMDEVRRLSYPNAEPTLHLYPPSWLTP